MCLEAFRRYTQGESDVRTYRIGELDDGLIPVPGWENCIYILRLSADQLNTDEWANIVNAGDAKRVLYIGGHSSGKITGQGRFNRLIEACRHSQKEFDQRDFVENDSDHHGHVTASWLTTSLLQSGFSIEHCDIDLIRSVPDADELELIIGYQETYHHLPPWNTVRGGYSGYQLQQSRKGDLPE